MKLLNTVILISLSINLLISQESELLIKGQVLDSKTNKPVEFVEIELVKKLSKSVTDKSGYYQLVIKNPKYPLLINYRRRGYNEIRIAIFSEEEIEKSNLIKLVKARAMFMSIPYIDKGHEKYKLYGSWKIKSIKIDGKKFKYKALTNNDQDYEMIVKPLRNNPLKEEVHYGNGHISFKIGCKTTNSLYFQIIEKNKIEKWIDQFNYERSSKKCIDKKEIIVFHKFRYGLGEIVEFNLFGNRLRLKTENGMMLLKRKKHSK